MTANMRPWIGTIGADPEMFIFAGNKLLPAYEFLPSKIDSPHQTLYWDGFQAEWKYETGAYCLTQFVWDTKQKIETLLNSAKRHNVKATLSLQNVVSIAKTLLKTAPEQYVLLGCEPSFNAYNLKSERIDNPRELKIRVAGGHIHFGGWKRKLNYHKYIKTLDSILGVWAVGAAQNIDIPLRRKYYGLAGEFRTPTYAGSLGLEYRTLSNFWLCHPRIMQLTFEIARGALMVANLKSNPWVATEEEVVKTINECDVKHAQKILMRNQVIFKDMLYRRSVFQSDKLEEAFQVGIKGVENSVDISSIEKNWEVTKSWSYDQVPTWRGY